VRIYRAKDYRDMSRKAANILSAQVILKPSSVLGLATGSSPLGVYEQLIDWYMKGDVDFSEASTINLDEYKGLGPENPQSYHYFMHENFFRRINILPQNTNIPDGLAFEDEECARYDRLIQRLGGIDMQLLGIGRNGHIGFNEPGASYDKDTHCVSLTESTIKANTRFFERPEDIPRQAYTMGIRSIMHSRRILVIASGEAKAAIVRDAFFGPVTPLVPASVLQLHNNVTLVGDDDALSMI
jgi:glucosamine-6-phosphate deaminase